MRLLSLIVSASLVLASCVGEELEPSALPLDVPVKPAPIKVPLRGDVSVSIKIDSVSTDSVLAIYSIMNSTLDPIEIDIAEFPEREAWMDVLDIRREGERIKYVGWLGESAHASTITIAAGGSVSRIINLNAFYSFAEIGNYEIVPRGIAFTSAGVEYRSTVSVATQLSITEGLVSAVKSPLTVRAAPGGSGTTTFPGTGATSCNSTQQAQLIAARAAALVRANNSYTSLAFGRNPGLYTMWMGARTQTRYSKVERFFKEIAYGLSVGDFRFFCDSNFVGFFAVVLPTAPYDITLGSLFWTAPANSGSDTQAGTLIHEVSHFNDVAGTGDWCSGRSTCTTLAVNDPDSAFWAANCYEYYAEDMGTTQIAALADTSIVPSSNVLSETSIDICPSPAGITFIGGRAYFNPIVSYTFNSGDYLSNTVWLSGSSAPVHCDYTTNGGNSFSGEGTPLVVPISALLTAIGM